MPVTHSSSLDKLLDLVPDLIEKTTKMLDKKLNKTKTVQENVIVKVSDENKEASLYIVATNTILIANIKNTFTRIQTIAHECIHSIQDKHLLWFNFIFSNIYLLYFRNNNYSNFI